MCVQYSIKSDGCPRMITSTMVSTLLDVQLSSPQWFGARGNKPDHRDSIIEDPPLSSTRTTGETKLSLHVAREDVMYSASQHRLL